MIECNPYLIQSLSIVSEHFNLPNDIFEHIYNCIINHYAQTIIQSWFSYINIHSTNLIILINKLPIKKKFLNNRIISYYDLNHVDTFITFKIVFKYISFNISCSFWWSKVIYNAFNGVYFIENFGQDSYYYKTINIIRDLAYILNYDSH